MKFQNTGNKEKNPKNFQRGKQNKGPIPPMHPFSRSHGRKYSTKIKISQEREEVEIQEPGKSRGRSCLLG
jgi:hypothetical protein